MKGLHSIIEQCFSKLGLFLRGNFDDRHHNNLELKPPNLQVGILFSSRFLVFSLLLVNDQVEGMPMSSWDQIM